MLFSPGTLSAMADSDAFFYETFFKYADETTWQARLRPRLAKTRLDDAYTGWTEDLKRMQTHERNLGRGLDHFKRGGHLAFWIRRFSPLVELEDPTHGIEDEGAYALNHTQTEFRNLLLDYNNEYLAFDFGFQFVQYYASNRLDHENRVACKVLSREYLETACHFLKFKSASPHSMHLIYRSIYV